MSVPLHPLRGRTCAGRLRALDAYLIHAEAALLARNGGAWCVDVGFGDMPDTTLEFAAALAQAHPGLRVLGVERESARVESAQQRAGSAAPVEFRQGGFQLPLCPEETVRLVRVLNVLRSYPQAEVAAAHAALGERLLPGGLVLEGSTDTSGAVGVVHLLRRTHEGLLRESLLFHTDFTRGFAPFLFRDWLPRDVRRRVQPGQPLHRFLSAWSQAWEATRARASPAEAFVRSVQHLAASGEPMSLDPWLLSHGFARWSPPGGVPT